MTVKFPLSRRSFLVMPLALAACKPGQAVLRFSGLTMGTGYSVVAVDHGRKLAESDLRTAVDAALAEVNAQMSNWDSRSEISRFNAAHTTEPVAISPELAHVIAGANIVHEASGGSFDITLSPLIELWGFGSGGQSGAAPEAEAIAAALAEAGQGQTLRLDGAQLAKSHPGASLFLSAIGKGYGVDRVAQALAGLGLTDFMIEIGGDLYTAGNNADGVPWRVGIEAPSATEKAVHQIVDVAGLGMATSGDYRNYFEQGGQRYSHILDGRTGRPITHHTTSVTVLAESAMMADAWATALMVMGKERGMAVAQDHGLAALFIERAADHGTPRHLTTASPAFAELQA